MPPFPASTVLGYPRIGPRRELKRALEAYWDGRATRADLDATGRDLRARTWQRLADLGLDGLPSNTFSNYDQVLDTAMLLGAVPAALPRPARPVLRDGPGHRGHPAAAHDEVVQHQLPLHRPGDRPRHRLPPRRRQAARTRSREARRLGHETRPVVIGPVTFLLLSEGAEPGFAPLDRLPDVLAEYERLLAALAAEGVAWVQLDEPAFVADRAGADAAAELRALRTAYDRLGARADRPAILVASYFGDLGAALPVLAATPVEAIGIDLVHGPVARPAVDLARQDRRRRRRVRPGRVAHRTAGAPSPRWRPCGTWAPRSPSARRARCCTSP